MFFYNTLIKQYSNKTKIMTEQCGSCKREMNSKNGPHLSWCVAHIRDFTIIQCGCCECVPGSKSIPPLISMYKKTTHVFKTANNEILPK